MGMKATALGAVPCKASYKDGTLHEHLPYEINATLSAESIAKVLYLILATIEIGKDSS